MMTHQLGFSVLTAPLAAIDRRALSQAWYSALHLAHDTSTARRTRVQAPASCPPRRPSAEPPARRTSRRQEAIEMRLRDRAPDRELGCAEHRPERRLLRSPLARKIERAFLHPAQRCERATFTLDGTAARVHVTLQGSGTDVRLVAICPAAVRARVARALEEARYALAVRGVACVLDVREASCS